jgi:iron(III) transport system substrate-binding protein
MKASHAAVAILAASSVVLAGCGGGSNSDGGSSAKVSLEDATNYTGGDRADFLRKCALKEGKVEVYTTQNPTLVDQLQAGFQKKYPGIKVAATRRNSPQTAEALTKESSAGVHKADVVNLKIEVAEDLLDQFVSFKSPALAAYPKEAIGKDNKFVSSGRVPYGVLYNTKKVSGADVPKTGDDLLDPKWKGEIAFSTTGPGTQWIGYMNSKYGEKWVESFGKQDIHTTAANTNAITAQVASGEAAIAPDINLSGADGILEADPKAPIKWVPIDSTWAEDTTEIANNAPHPCAAMLYVDYLISKEGQSINPSYYSFRTDVPKRDVLGGVEPVGVWGIVGSHDPEAYKAASKKWTALIDKYIIN